MIGMSDMETEGEWIWVTGEPFEYENFNRGYENHPAKDNAYVMDYGYWYSYEDSVGSYFWKLGFVVEFCP